MERRQITIEGTVQGVGFRPFVYAAATRRGLGGFVRNQPGGVRIEVEGEPAALDDFLADLTGHAPPLARVESLRSQPRPALGERGFRIEPSGGDAGGEPVVICADAAVCPECLAEMRDPGARRFGYPFTNCTQCGPRLTIVTGAPYDRERTTMAGFTMCPECRAEYENPLDRRFHAQPIACPVCGPSLTLCGPGGEVVAARDPLGEFAAVIRTGGIGAVKGLGGYHLACDAADEGAVAELRRRKHRDEKPLAVMAADLDAAEELCELDEAARRLLTSAAAPIVVVPRREAARLAHSVAPGNSCVGMMLPYTPLHHLLMRAAGGRTLVMTSGNRADEPIATAEPEVFEQLRGIADLYLIHNRPIHVRCDDSVVRVVGGAAVPVRRSRGYAPQPIRLARPCPVPVLAVGGQLKATFVLAAGRAVTLSHHLGDLDHLSALEAFERDVGLYERLLSVRPGVIAHDLHPDYGSTRYALRRAGAEGVRAIAVQHHHAHMASCMAEHGLEGPVIGVIFDGSGLGTDGTVWGGEFLIGDYRDFRRAAHLRPVALPGGEQAVREPWRMAAAHLLDAGLGTSMLANAAPEAARRAVEVMIARGVHSPRTSSVGRLFDAVAAMAGVRLRVSYEGQAAAELEGLAGRGGEASAYAWEVAGEGPLAVDARPLIRGVAEDVAKGAEPGVIARRFHATLAQIVLKVCERLRTESGVGEVVLSGGVFVNGLLSGSASRLLNEAGFRVYAHRRVPCNDGGLSLGQAAVAAALC